ncbi:MAG: protein kinase [Vicinamibacterales bacterium]
MIGRQFQHYRILRQLGAGGMGVVYEAEDTRLGRHVALKFLPESVGLAAEVVERFEREARIASSLNHPSICTIFDIGVEDDRRFIVMELLEGDALRARIGTRPLPVEEILDIGVQIADALDAAHAKGIVHRDIKPANIFITKRGQAKLLDFGIAKLGGEAHAAAADETRAAGEALTMAGMAIGSVNYMSPEQARGEDLDARTDLFSLGLVLYEMATGQQAFGGQTTAVVFDGILNRQPTDARSLNPELPEELVRVIERALEKDRRVRFQSAADMLAELKRARRDTGGTGAVAWTASTAAAATGATGTAARRRRAGWRAANRRHRAGPGGREPRPGGADGPPRPVAASSRRWLIRIAAAVAIVAIGGYLYRNYGETRTPAFAERDRILIADFENSTGETVFDDALKQAVSVQFQQTPFVTLLPDQQIQSTLRLMQRPADQPVTGPVARELCQRAGARATVEGSIAPLGSAYVITLGVHNCATGASIAQTQVQAERKEDVLTTVGDAVTDLRRNLGESLASLEKYDVPVTEASTASLEALKAYGLGLRTRVTTSDEASIPFFQQAATIDPDFALAHAKLSVVYSNLNRSAEAEDEAKKAYALRDKVSEYERLYITWNHAVRVEHDDQKTRETLELMAASYPRDFTARNNLGVFYTSQGDYEKAIEQYRIAIEIAPSEPLPIANMAWSLINLGRFDEAFGYAERSLALRPNGDLAVGRWRAAVASNDPRAEAFREAAQRMATREQYDSMVADVALWRGQLQEYRRIMDGVERGYASRGDEQQVGLTRLNANVNLALMNTSLNLAAADGDESLVAVEAVLANTAVPIEGRAQITPFVAALGHLEVAKRSVARLEATGRTDAAIRDPLDGARAYIAAREGRFDEAIRLFEQQIRKYPQQKDLPLHLGLIQQMAGRLDDAAANFERVLQTAPSLGLSTFLPFARLSLARIRIEQGRTEDARAQINALRAQWKDADTRFPALEQVEAMEKKIG